MEKLPCSGSRIISFGSRSEFLVIPDLTYLFLGRPGTGEGGRHCPQSLPGGQAGQENTSSIW